MSADDVPRSGAFILSAEVRTKLVAFSRQLEDELSGAAECHKKGDYLKAQEHLVHAVNAQQYLTGVLIGQVFLGLGDIDGYRAFAAELFSPRNPGEKE